MGVMKSLYHQVLNKFDTHCGSAPRWDGVRHRMQQGGPAKSSHISSASFSSGLKLYPIHEPSENFFLHMNQHVIYNLNKTKGDFIFNKKNVFPLSFIILDRETSLRFPINFCLKLWKVLFKNRNTLWFNSL